MNAYSGIEPLTSIVPLGVKVQPDAVSILSGALARAGEIHAETYGRTDADIHAILIAHAFVIAEIIRARSRPEPGRKNTGIRWWSHWFNHALKEALSSGENAAVWHP